MDGVHAQKLATLRDAPQQVVKVIRGYRDTLQALRSRWDLAAEARDRGRELARAEAASRLAELRTTTERLATELQETLTRTANKAPRLGLSETAQVQSLTTRLRASEDLNLEANVVAHAAAAVGDAARLNALRVTLPDIASERHVVVDPAVADFLTLVTADADAREALTALAEMRRGTYRLNVTLGLAEFDLSQGSYDDPQHASVLPGWGDELLTIEATAPA